MSSTSALACEGCLVDCGQYISNRQEIYDCICQALIYCTTRFVLLQNHPYLLNELILLHKKFTFDQYS
jgi:hypothetical protein